MPVFSGPCGLHGSFLTTDFHYWEGMGRNQNLLGIGLNFLHSYFMVTISGEAVFPLCVMNCFLPLQSGHWTVE